MGYYIPFVSLKLRKALWVKIYIWKLSELSVAESLSLLMAATCWGRYRIREENTTPGQVLGSQHLEDRKKLLSLQKDRERAAKDLGVDHWKAKEKSRSRWKDDTVVRGKPTDAALCVSWVTWEGAIGRLQVCRRKPTGDCGLRDEGRETVSTAVAPLMLD